MLQAVLVLLSFIFFYPESAGLEPIPESQLNPLMKSPFSKSPDFSKNINYIEAKAGENKTLSCSRNSKWKFPNDSNADLAGYDFDDFGQRHGIVETNESSLLDIWDLRQTDTGLYQCTDFDFLDSRQFYIFVKKNIFLDETHFLKRSSRPANFTIGMKNSAVIPCRTTSLINVTNMKLIVNGEEWTGFCFDISDNSTQKIRIINQKDFNYVGNPNCTQIFKYYDPRVGFDFGPIADQLPWKQSGFDRGILLGDPSPNGCVYQNEEIIIELKVLMAIPFKSGTPQMLIGGTLVNCSISHTFYAEEDRLLFYCKNCSSQDPDFIDQLLKRLKNNRTLEDIDAFHKSQSKNGSSVFCDWPGNVYKEFKNPTILPKVQESSILNSVGLSIIIIIIILFLFLFLLGTFMIKKWIAVDRKSNNSILPGTEVEMTSLKSNEEVFEVRRSFIGYGAYGQVFLLDGYDEPAVEKCLMSKNLQHLTRFKQEFEVLKLLKHPNVVQLIQMESFEGSEEFGIIMEYCQRGDLRESLFNPTIIYTIKTVLIWGEELFDAVDYMFRKHGIIHRDIKPENIFLTESFFLKIGDFGLAKTVEDTCTGTSMGTQRYMSPLQFEEETLSIEEGDLYDSHRNDVYGLGLVLWEIIERRIVFSQYGLIGSFRRDHFLYDIIRKRFDHLVAPRCQEEIKNIIGKCTRFVRRDRPMATEILEELQLIAKNDPFLAKLDFVPLIEEEQKKILRPIGFDGSMNRVPIESEISLISDDFLPPSSN